MARESVLLWLEKAALPSNLWTKINCCLLEICCKIVLADGIALHIKIDSLFHKLQRVSVVAGHWVLWHEYTIHSYVPLCAASCFVTLILNFPGSKASKIFVSVIWKVVKSCSCMLLKQSDYWNSIHYFLFPLKAAALVERHGVRRGDGPCFKGEQNCQHEGGPVCYITPTRGFPLPWALNQQSSEIWPKQSLLWACC